MGSGQYEPLLALPSFIFSPLIMASNDTLLFIALFYRSDNIPETISIQIF